ncbi:MAG: hypothetical protein QW215_02360 [Ignisphaera sp.]
MKCIYRTFHEYRFSLGVLGLAGIMTGLIDALALDWTVKAFLWSSALIIAMSITTYELTVMPTPENPFLQSILLIITSLMGLLSIHHFTWIFVWTITGGEIHEKLWLAPNIYIEFNTYTTIMAILLTIYILHIIYCNICSAEER